jgi:hypothetical protein
MGFSRVAPARLIVALAVACLAHATVAAPEGFMDPDIGVLFPPQLGKLQLQGVNEFDDPGLGRSLSYSGHGLEATVYIYSLGLPEIPEDPHSEIVREEFENRKRDIYQIEGRGAIEHIGDRIVAVDGKSTQVAMHEAKFRFTQQETIRWSYLYLFSESGSFVKLRLTCELAEAKCDRSSDSLTSSLVRRLSHKSREVIPRNKFREGVELLITDPYGDHADALRAVLYVYVDNIRPEFVMCVPQFAPLLDSNNEDHRSIWVQIAISSGDYLLVHPEAIDDEHRYQVAGIEGALRMYENMLETNPDVRHEFLEGLIALRDEGRLGEHVQAHSCKN